MYANKLKHQRPAFVAIRGAISWFLLMGVWFLYPYVQNSQYESHVISDIETTNEPLEVKPGDFRAASDEPQEGFIVVEAQTLPSILYLLETDSLKP